jgi:hypothetical protein
MTTLSDPTLGLLTRVGDKAINARNIKTLMMETDIFKYGDREDNKAELIRSRLVGARAAADAGDGEARRALLAFVGGLVGYIVGGILNEPDWMDELQERLRSSRFGLAWGNGTLVEVCPQIKRALPTRCG